jgi:hypothetical protein
VKPRAFAILALLVLALLPADGLGILLCPFHLLTGIACPLCGLTRSASSMLQGNWSAGFAYHPLGIFVLLWLLVLVCLSEDQQRKIHQHTALTRFALPGTVLVFLAVWVYRYWI